MAMTGLLCKSIRDAQGRLHKLGERLTVMGRLSRANFDTRPLLKVRFEDGSLGVVFSEEFELVSSTGEFGSAGADDRANCFPL
jgi:hypothetical protein